MQKVIRVAALLIVVGMVVSFKKVDGEKTKLEWLSLQQVELKSNETRKPVLIDLYTEWCGWCKVMDKKTYANSAVAAYVNEKFYPAKIDAETKETLKWNGRTYSYNSDARVNSYALYLTRGQLAFPTTVIIPSDGSAPQVVPGYIELKEMELLLKYFGEGHYGKTPFTDYQKKFVASWR